MGKIFENSFLVNSFHAVNKNTGAVYEAASDGYISVKAGDVIVFESPYVDGEYVPLNTIEVFTKNTPFKALINPGDNRGLYPMYVKANSQKGIQYMRIDSITMECDCDFYYEGLST